MGRFFSQVQAFALAWGGPGLFVVGFLDSSFLSLPEINDILLVWMVTQHKARLPLYVLGATLGSIAGCLVLYYLARKGGDALVRRRFHGSSVDHAMALFQRYGAMAVLIPSILPPPAPFKIFVLLAGVVGISSTRFVVAIAIGRSVRYLIEGLLAVRYGDQVTAWLHVNGTAMLLWLVGVLGVGLAGYVMWVKAWRGQGRGKAPINRVS